LHADPDYFDAKIAGWWCWGACAWIGTGWCSGEGPWNIDDTGALTNVREEWIGLVAQATAILRAKFENELPPVLSGLDATGIQRECRRAIDEVLQVLHEA
jgi:hypothetical protein